jgi:hypothetical protein
MIPIRGDTGCLVDARSTAALRVTDGRRLAIADLEFGSSGGIAIASNRALMGTWDSLATPPGTTGGLGGLEVRALR